MPSDAIWLPAIFSDNMMLQADVPAVIWGRTQPRQRLEIQIAGVRRRTVADAQGAFRVQLPPLQAGGPHLLTIRGKTERTFENVLVGDVWLCAGQSNMAMSVRGSRDADAEMAAARFPKIRLFTVAERATVAPCADVRGAWLPCSPQSVGDFSATAYFFARELHSKTGRPMGLINASWGGTRIEPWISPASLQQYPGFSKLMRPHRKYLKPEENPDADTFHLDRSNTGAALGWAAADGPKAGWRKIKLPGYWTKQGLECVGAFWFRKTVTVPETWRGEDLYLSLGPIVDFDTTYVNGVRVGGIGIETKNFWDVPRKYLVPAALIKPGRNLVAVRVFAHNINGGFGGPKQCMQLSVINKPARGTLSLSGGWEYKIERALPRKTQLSQGDVPGTLFNAMIHPLIQFPLKGFLWYQGESNIDEPRAYSRLFPLLIKDWRKRWGSKDLPFYFAHLPDYPRADDVSAKLPLLREAQTAALKVPHTGMAVIIDGGEKDIHPKNKQLVGHRLALVALARTYGKQLCCAGPMFEHFSLEGAEVRVRFDQALTTLAGAKPAEFVIAGADRNFLPAQARIEGDSVWIWSQAVRKPLAVRYAWGCTPLCTLYNKAGLPAVPFRTDSW